MKLVARARLAVLAVALVMASLVPAYAQDETAAGASYLTPFPENDTYRVLVLGDSLADGLAGGMSEAFGADQRMAVTRKPQAFYGVLRNEFEDEQRTFEDAIQKAAPHVVVVVFGTQDRVPLKAASGKRVAIGSEEWRAEYGRRLDRMMKTLKRRNVAVYWVGLPVMRRADANDDAQTMNELMRERAYQNGLKFVDAYAGFVNEDGEYDKMGPDVAGNIVRLREADGLHFTPAGYRKLAHLVERELRRDMTQAKSERAIPLAGSEAEQARINPNKVPDQAVGGTTMWQGLVQRSKTGKPGEGTPSGMTADGTGEQKADNSRIALKVVGVGGKEETVAVDILRPAIPASVIALMTRRESPDKATQVGDIVVDQIAGGLTVMSSITPANTSPEARRKLAPTQTPFFRALVKGERLPTKPGRADEMIWPRPEPQLPPEPAKVAAPPAQQAPAATPPADRPAKKVTPSRPPRSGSQQ